MEFNFVRLRHMLLDLCTGNAAICALPQWPVLFFFGGISGKLLIYIAADWNLEPDFGNLPYPEKVTGTNRSDLGKIDKIYDTFTFCETVHRNQNLEPLPKMARREPKMTTLSQFFTRKVPVKLAK